MSEESGSRKPWRSIALVALAVLLFGMWFFLPVGSWIDHATGTVRELGILGMVLYGALYAVGTVLLIPGAILTLAAGVAFGLGGVVVVVVGATIGATLAFGIARYVARSSVEARLGNSPRLGAIDAAIAENGWKVVLLLRLSPVFPFSLQNYLYGITRVRPLPYVLSTFFGIIPGAFLYVYIGAVGKTALTGGGSTAKTVILIAGLAATALVTILVTRAAKAKLAELSDE